MPVPPPCADCPQREVRRHRPCWECRRLPGGACQCEGFLCAVRDRRSSCEAFLRRAACLPASPAVACRCEADVAAPGRPALLEWWWLAWPCRSAFWFSRPTSRPANRSFGHRVNSRGREGKKCTRARGKKNGQVRETKSKTTRERRHPVCGGVEPGRAAWQASARSPRQGFTIGRHEPAARPPTSARGGRLNLRAPQRPATSGTCTPAATRLTPPCARRARQPADSKGERSPYRQPAYYGGPSYSSVLPSAALTCLSRGPGLGSGSGSGSGSGWD